LFECAEFAVGEDPRPASPRQGQKIEMARRPADRQPMDGRAVANVWDIEGARPLNVTSIS
jgi:hypothetical protein